LSCKESILKAKKKQKESVLKKTRFTLIPRKMLCFCIESALISNKFAWKMVDLCIKNG